MPTKKPRLYFERRHYEFLADFAGRHLSPQTTELLAKALAEDNPRFQADRFTVICAGVRVWAMREAHRRQQEEKAAPQVWADIAATLNKPILPE